MLKLQIIIASTRPGRVGPAIGQWFLEAARRHGGFDAQLVDLADYNLPLFDEAGHPRLGKYANAHTRAWSEKIDEADAFVFVTPEYNFGTPPSLANALTYLAREWHYKPLGFVSYGGVSGGLRGVQMTKQYATTLKMMPLPEQVVIPGFAQHLDTEGRFQPGALHEQSATDMLNELLRWAEALAVLRKPEHAGNGAMADRRN